MITLTIITVILALILKELQEIDPKGLTQYKKDNVIFEFLVILIFVMSYFPGTDNVYLVVIISTMFVFLKRLLMAQGQYPDGEISWN